jgi:hypothetical protein
MNIASPILAGAARVAELPGDSVSFEGIVHGKADATSTAAHDAFAIR